MKRGGPRRDWKDARAKVDREGECRRCGKRTGVEAAHIMERSHDEPKTPGSKTLYVKPERIVPLCGPFPAGCHGAYDHHKIDLLHLLTGPEQAQAVADAGSIETARRKLCPSAYAKEST